jgi:3-isopropylmalate dehydratase small subunit
MDATNLVTIRGRGHLLGDEVNTDIHCSSKYLPGRDNAYIAAHAFEQLVADFPGRFRAGGVIVAGRNFGINSSREQSVHVMRAMGVAAIVAASFGRQFFRNAINNGLPAVVCDVVRLADGDEIEIDLAGGVVAVPARGMSHRAAPLPPEMMAILAAGGLIPYLKAHPGWAA